jgi:hypothetical protein
MKALVEGEVTNLGELDEGTGVDWGRVDKVCIPLLVAVFIDLMAGIQNGRDEPAQGSRTTPEKGSSSRNGGSH